MKSEDIIKVENLNRGNSFIIRWNLTYLCNYSCDFCIQGNKKEHIDKSKVESIKIRTKICDNLIKFIENNLNNKYEFIKLYLIGGEITILKDFLDIIEKIVNSKFDGKIEFKITSNLSAKKEIFVKLLEIFKNHDNRELHISASFYKEFAKENEFIEKIKLLNKKEKLFSKIIRKIKMKDKYISEKNIVSIGYPLCCDKDYEDYLTFKKKYEKITTDIFFIVKKKNKTSITDELKVKLASINSINNKIKVTFRNGELYYCSNNNKISLKLKDNCFKSKGYLCDIGVNSISISNEGIVSLCPSCKDKTVIGNIIDYKFNLPRKKHICKAETCNCSYYGVIEKKVKNEE